MKAKKQSYLRLAVLWSSLLLLPFLASSQELTETRQFDSFDKIVATNGINIILRKASEEKAEVKIENALLSDVITEVKNGTLKLRMRPQINKELSVLVVVYYKNIKEITVSKGASLETQTVILQNNLTLHAATGGTIKAEIECTDVKTSASGGSAISLYGWAKRLEATANTKSNLYAQNLKADKALIRAATGAEMWVKPKDYFEAVANTGGIIYYTANPKQMNQRVSSGGEIINKTKGFKGELKS